MIKATFEIHVVYTSDDEGDVREQTAQVREQIHHLVSNGLMAGGPVSPVEVGFCEVVEPTIQAIG